ncbi:alpha/beta hydrolase [Kibdelosporangium philippinense]|uniref:Alpha/beta hydrolase n=1 Tax=Kibdelosporangium philippinense TaxID=211113 RepID=A0ABS8ZUS3_9PSEU|nr:alpha/beta fold hydrolase [Kibdelosporangium philippinense]MCE7010173.1 alpha/beta hydrolase [Kibdelosporangium philippinense]
MATFGELAGDQYGAADDRPGFVLLHGLTYDRTQWAPLINELARIDPGRSVLALDLPGHGESPPRASYDLEEVAAAINDSVTEAGLTAPVVVGHSLGGAIMTIYGGNYPVRRVVNVDQPLRVGGFSAMLRSVEPVLRGPGYLEVWESLLSRMGIDQLPPNLSKLVRTATTPRQDLLLGYWHELLVLSAEELDARRTAELARFAAAGIPYEYVSGGELDPAYRDWLETVSPGVEISILDGGGGHFPHLARPLELAKILAAA